MCVCVCVCWGEGGVCKRCTDLGIECGMFCQSMFRAGWCFLLCLCLLVDWLYVAATVFLTLFFVLIQESIQHFGYMCVSRASSTVMGICCCLS